MTKRSQNVNLAAMRKPVVFPLSALAAAVALSGCGSSGEEAYLYNSVSECVAEHPDSADICQQAYEEAQLAALDSGPRYANQNLCETEFGAGQCQPQAGGSFWTPFVAGYLVGEIIDEVGDYAEYKLKKRSGYYSSTPVFLSTKSGRPAYYGMNEQKLGNFGDKTVRASSSAYQRQAPKVRTASTVSRGGFGTTVRSSSSSSSSRSWGG
ncbi:DUF1190 domain-containing protein [Salinibius halmophilus]|uniref:DUF1190 domain-containing protein n=1 Tax=Salinibius halmophilus TaxID=1853216 RepID=UPI0013140577|nr:DUF1190 domain-containing protein [Salinibius halmophilus]